MTDIFSEALDMLFPQGIYCICCGSILDGSRPYAVCDDCLGKFSWITEDTCSVCGKPLAAMNRKRRICYSCAEREHSFDKGYTCAQYGLYERAIVMDLKYRDKSYLAGSVGRIMADRIEAELGTDLPWDAVTWVPVHRKRLAERGYDQAELIAAAFMDAMAEKTERTGRAGGIPALEGFLERAQSTRPMKDLGLMERMENVSGAFRVKKEENVRGKTILIIDDVYTTGATLDACALALKAAGAGRVEILTFASGGDYAGARGEDDPDEGYDRKERR